MSALPNNPLDAFVSAYADRGMSIGDARDLIILRCLSAGDVSAFSYFVLTGHQPGREVLRTLAYMMANAVPAAIEDQVPFTLVSKARRPSRAGKRPDPLVEMRDELIALNVEAEKKGGRGSYDAAILTVHERAGKAVSTKTIRNAYDRYARQGKKSAN